MIYIESAILHDSSPSYEIEDGDFSWIEVKTYTREDGSALYADDFKDNLGKKVTLKTKGEEGTNFALRVPSDTVVRVETAWGDVLYTNASDAPHDDGDYLVCNNVDGSADLSDVWVVNGEIFPKTYDMTYAL